MQVIFLGTSTTGSTNRNFNSIAIRRNDELILFDCGEGTLRQMKIAKVGFGLRTKVFITHLHGDHINGLPGFLRGICGYPDYISLDHILEIYGPKGIQEFVNAIRSTILGAGAKKLKGEKIIEVSEGVVCTEDDYIVQAVWTKHAVPNLAYAIIENDKPNRPSVKVVYSGDTRPCKSIIELAKDADLLIYEATLDDEFLESAKKTGHSTLSEGPKIAREAGVKQLILTHIGALDSQIGPALEKARKIFPNTEIAEDFMVIEVPYVGHPLRWLHQFHSYYDS
jgi:ribonuclease Z